MVHNFGEGIYNLHTHIKESNKEDVIKDITKNWTEKDKKDFSEFVDSFGKFINLLYFVMILLNPFIMVPASLIGISITLVCIFNTIEESSIEFPSFYSLDDYLHP